MSLIPAIIFCSIWALSIAGIIWCIFLMRGNAKIAAETRAIRRETAAIRADTNRMRSNMR